MPLKKNTCCKIGKHRFKIVYSSQNPFPISNWHGEEMNYDRLLICIYCRDLTLSIGDKSTYET